MRALLALTLTGAAAVTLPASAAALNDFGDAPDGGAAGYGSGAAHFPSLARSNGPRHARIGPLLLGHGESSETDSRQVDVDPLDDGFAAELQPCQVSHVQFVVNAAGLPAALRTAGHKAYLNAWFDFNRDGRWAGGGRCGGRAAPEWGVKNVAIQLGSFARRPIQVVQVDIVAGARTKDIWQRATLTLDQRVKQLGGRRGRFRYGETEDYGPRQLVRVPRGGGRGNAVLPLPDDRPSLACLAEPTAKTFAPAGMSVFIEHGDFTIFRLQVSRGRGTVTTTIGKPRVFGSQPEGIGWFLDPAAAPTQWNTKWDLWVASTAEDARDNPVQLVIIPVKVKGPGIGTLRTSCLVVVAHEVLTPAGANTPQPGGSGQTIDTTVGPPVITGGGQTTDGGGNGSTTIVG